MGSVFLKKVKNEEVNLEKFTKSSGEALISNCGSCV